MNRPCSIPECTVAQTGVCLQNNDAEACPNRTAPETLLDVDASIAPLDGPVAHARFPSSLTLGPDELQAVAARRYCHLVGILGLPGSGKTAALVSTYLLLGKGKLKGFEFLDSKSLRALDEIAHGAREWKQGQPFEQITAHTELADDRTPGFMHLRLRRERDQRAIDLLLPDLPGEWSTALIDTERTDRLDFLQGADALWIVIDGDELKGRRNLIVHRTELLLARLAAFLTRRPPVFFVITRRDYGAPEQEAVDALTKEAAKFGFSATISAIASFKTGSESKPGFGIAELIDSVGRVDGAAPEFWPATPRSSGRAMLRFRGSDE